VRYALDEKQRFVVENYNWASPFSNFLPGIGGKWGIPIWVFYVSRGQAVCSFGVRDKDHSIMEFLSFNRALQLVYQQGFRTFVKLDGKFYEPFQRTTAAGIKQCMIISSEELELAETGPHGLEFRVAYYPIVNEPVGALVREVRIRNYARRRVRLELLDGAPRVIPYGTTQEHLKTIPRHIEGMMGVDSLDGIPVFRLKQTPADISRVGKIEAGHFYFTADGRSRILRGAAIVDPAIVFGEPETYFEPVGFQRSSVDQLLKKNQVRENRTPCAFTAMDVELPAGEELVFWSVFGSFPNPRKFRRFLRVAKRRRFFERKREENRRVIGSIKSYAFTVSSSPAFDAYCEQNFLDNVLRGGMPVVFGKGENKKVFYIFSRMHGDLERDYHFFVLEPNYFSQGTGLYRDPLQNRRRDVWFFPEIGDFNLKLFVSMLQLDGYNPQIVSRLTYTVENWKAVENLLRKVLPPEHVRDLKTLLSGSFTPGELVMKLEDAGIRNREQIEAVLSEVMENSRQNDVGALHEGFWIDHWTYNLDLIDAFLEIYPERLEEMLLSEVYTFFDNPDVVLPRDLKHVCVDGKIRQYSAVVRDQEKLERIRKRKELPSLVRTRHGNGEIYRTSLLVKLLTLLANRIATLDHRGVGIEMEADKPGWNDSANGLPGIFGSSLCETLELIRLCRFLISALEKIDVRRKVRIFEELVEFMRGLQLAIQKRLNGGAPFEYWDESNELKERYRSKTKFGISGNEIQMPIAELERFTRLCLALLERIFEPENMDQILSPSGVPYTYFINEVTDYQLLWEDRKRRVPRLGPSGFQCVKVKRFRSRPVALFLEGPVHMIRVEPQRAAEVYRAVRRSALYDRKLRMFKVCESLEKEPFEIGRVKAYACGWLENESVYLHMEYKWLLELLRSGLYSEFFREIKNTLIPFLDPRVYGRSILEGVSAIVSSAFPDRNLHGRGVQPRLSGATAEMIHMWTLMVAGRSPFYLKNGALRFALRPILPGWLFTREPTQREFYEPDGTKRVVKIPSDAFAFRFLGRCLVIYRNPKRVNTYDRGAYVSLYRLTYRDGRKKTVQGPELDEPIARDIRDGKVTRIEAIISKRVEGAH
jgi:hypothetical protein